MKPLISTYRDVPAATIVGGVLQPAYVEAAYAGSFFYAKSANAAFDMAFDAGQFFNWDGGFKITNVPFSKITFCNNNLFKIRVNFYVGVEAVDYIGTNFVKTSPTYALGNLGLSVSGNYNAGGIVQAITLGGDGFINIGANDITIFGINNGNPRRTIIISTHDYTVPKQLIIADADGNNFCQLSQAQMVQFETSADIVIKAAGTTATFNVGEIFYSPL